MSKPVIEGRIYVGNVDFSATEEELKDFFQGLNVVSVEIPSKTLSRGNKSFVKRLGFGFVQFASDADAEKAIAEFNGKEFKSRHMYAKKALPPATEEEKQKKAEAFFAKREALKAKKEAKKETKKQSKKEAKKEAGESKKNDKESPETPSKSPELEAKAEGEVIRKEKDLSKTPEGTKSKDTVFITNLEYRVTLSALTRIFKDLELVWVHVPTKRVPQHVLKKFKAKNKPLFNKGYAFAKFASEENQQKAIAEFNGHEIHGRAILVEAAVDRPNGEGKPVEAGAEGEEAGAKGEKSEEVETK